MTFSATATSGQGIRGTRAKRSQVLHHDFTTCSLPARKADDFCTHEVMCAVSVARGPQWGSADFGDLAGELEGALSPFVGCGCLAVNCHEQAAKPAEREPEARLFLWTETKTL